MDPRFVDKRPLFCASLDNGRQHVYSTEAEPYPTGPNSGEGHANDAHCVYFLLYVLPSRVSSLLDREQWTVHHSTVVDNPPD